jgi:Icc-related predicted phosphoesterase
LKILHLTDIHSDCGNLKKIIDKENFDLCLISGDLTHFGHKDDLLNVLKILGNSGIRYYAATGNCDFPDVESHLKTISISLEQNIVNIGGYQIAGLSGSLPCPGKTPNVFSEEQFLEKLIAIENQLNKGKPLIFATHQPPYKTINDKVMAGVHVGSLVIRNFIEKHQPLVCLTGHIHEGKGVDFIGKCPIINPGPAKDGHYAIIELTGETTPRIEIH